MAVASYCCGTNGATRGVALYRNLHVQVYVIVTGLFGGERESPHNAVFSFRAHTCTLRYAPVHMLLQCRRNMNVFKEFVV